MNFEDYWQAGEQPLSATIGEETGGFDFWQAEEQPPIFHQSPIIRAKIIVCRILCENCKMKFLYGG